MTTPLLLAAAMAATIPLRNPFWPIGYDGEREPISAEPRFEVSIFYQNNGFTARSAPTEEETLKDAETSVNPEAIAAAEAAEAASHDKGEGRLWIAARKSLRIGGTLRVGSGTDSRQAVNINGNIYADGDLVSANVDGLRFTWRVKGLTETGTLRLQRIRMRELEEPSEDKGENK